MAGPLSDDGVTPAWADLGFLARSLVPAGRGAADRRYASALSRMLDLDEYVRGRITQTVNELNAREAAKAARAVPPARPATPAIPSSRPAPMARPERQAPPAPAHAPVRSEYREALLANPNLAGAIARLGDKLNPRAPAASAHVQSQPAPAAAPSPEPEGGFVASHPTQVRAGLKPASRFRKTFEGVHPIYSDRPTAER